MFIFGSTLQIDIFQSPLFLYQVHHPLPTTRWINPSDCVDMDCDARRKVVFTDIDGKIFGKAGTSVISKSEFGWSGDGWDGDRKWGLGNVPLHSFLFWCFYGVIRFIRVRGTGFF